MSDFKVSDVVLYNGTLKGTVEYVGTTHFAAGTWYGVKLDTPKGKNDGSVAGKSYFKCEKNHGIFVRNTQLTKIETDEPVSTDSKIARPSALRKPTAIKNENTSAVTPTEEVKEIPENTYQETESKADKPIELKEGSSHDEQVQDLMEKLQTLQIKRSEDKEKLKDYEKLKMRVQQLEENKKHIQEKAAEYQRGLDKVKQDYAKLTEEFDNYREETATLADNIEMLTIDKEMAEEKLDSYRSEIELLKSKNEEISLENEILKLEKGGSQDVVSDEAQLVMLKSQNSKLRDAIILMRDISENQKVENEKNVKEITRLQGELEKCVKERDRLLVDLKDCQESIIELKEQVDSALGADEMVSDLTEKNLTLEESVRALEEAKVELEELCDMNNEINENNASLMSELKFEIANKDVTIQELNQALVAKNEFILDYEDTIEKFRDLVKDLQNQIKDLKQQADSNTESSKNQHQIALEKSSEIYKTKIYETKTIATIIESELQKLEVSQTTNHVQMLEKFLPDKFFKTGSDNDSIMMILLIDKLIFKIEFLSNQIKEKFLSIPTVDTPESVVPTVTPESISYYYKLIYLLSTWYSILRHYKKTLNSCQLSTFSRLGSLFIEMSPNEKSVDYLIDLLKKGNLDENSSLEPLERSINYFQTFYQVHLVNEQPDYNVKLNDFVKIMMCGAESMEYCCKYIMNSLRKYNKEDSESYEFAFKLQQFGIDLKTNTKNIRKHLVNSGSLQFSNNLLTSLDKCVTDLSAIMKIITSFSLELASCNDEDDAKQLNLSTVYKYIEKFMEIRNISTTQPIFSNTENILKVSLNISNSLEHGEYDFDGTPAKTDEPIVVIALNFKNELSELENTCYKLEHKDEELRQAKVNLKMKVDELSEMSVRLNIVEKKLSTNVKEKDEIIERLEQKLEQTKAALIRKEKELDQTSEALQSDINHLESQKEELKRQLKETKKRNFLDNINISSAKVSSDQSDAANHEIGAFVNEIQTLRIIIQNLRNENLRLRSVTSTKHINQMKPLSIPIKPNANTNGSNRLDSRFTKIENLTSAINESERLFRDIYSHLSAIKVVDLSNKNPDKLYLNELSTKSRFKSQFDMLKRDKGAIVNEDCLFNKIWNSSHHNVESKNSNNNEIGCINFTRNLEIDKQIPVLGSSLTVAKLHNIFSY